MSDVTVKQKNEPLFHVVKREDITRWQAIGIRAIAIVAALIVSGILILVLSGKNPVLVYQEMFLGAFGSERRIWVLLQNMAILLGLSLAVTPAFKMKFWNCGAEGQALIAGLAAALMMYYAGPHLPRILLLPLTLLVCLLTGAIWALIPAIFKAHWGTNETLFTLMMNYIAIRLVAFSVKWIVSDGSGTLPRMEEYGMPALFGRSYLFNILIIALVTVLLYIYLSKSKHGYEISVVGESQSTARYIGIDVKRIILRTMILSGALCGLVGFLLVAGTDFSVNTDTVGGLGFTAIMVSWLAKFNPLYMVLTTLLIVFMQRGALQVTTKFNVDKSISDIVTGIVLFFIIGCEFFIHYKLVLRTRTPRGSGDNTEKEEKAC